MESIQLLQQFGLPRVKGILGQLTAIERPMQGSEFGHHSPFVSRTLFLRRLGNFVQTNSRPRTGAISKSSINSIASPGMEGSCQL